ncbi:MAG: C4-dicarboxylate ABC transporter substrate-binding protein [Roseovarius sp. BRH_c41]|uniref:TAXI family TRAP transporter solute-binding subunit n=1 Tax=Roseovarius sp. BRH_c41 TaxID=1629709 RepID=UPI0005F1A5AF|nr:TAXI family TRAP transporter solute-binding subunit [Roseovarius sp. BRH_c41]KJS43135.1 MAG: C4-dicarboxylate ABC transporter substrate-binding protein [Roseovarius sp. BRH_c41]
MNYIKTVAVSTALATTLSAGAGHADEFITIGTGGVTGAYYPAGGAICRLVNQTRKEHGIRCSVESTGGSIYNINTIREGELQFGIAQSDWQYHAFNGSDQFQEAGAFEGLRAVLALHPEAFTVVARADAGVTNFDDLEGKRVNLGPLGSGTRANMDTLMAEKGWTTDSFALATELKVTEQSAALCDNQIDAFVMTTGHPAGSLSEATTTCEAVMVEVAGDAVDALVAENSYYRTATIPGGMYAGTHADTATFGVGATLVTSANVSDEAVYVLVKAIFDNIEEFRGFHPAFATLKEDEMISAGLSAPLHPGAEKYYRERGWLE